MQKELEFNKIGMIETSAVLAGFTLWFSAHFWPLAMTAILGYLVNSAVRTLLFGYFGRKIYRPGLHFSLASGGTELTLWCPADGGQHHQLSQHQPFNAGAGAYSRRGRGRIQLAYNVAVVPPMKLEPDHHPRVVSGICQIQDDTESCALTSTSCCRWWGLSTFRRCWG